MLGGDFSVRGAWDAFTRGSVLLFEGGARSGELNRVDVYLEVAWVFLIEAR